MADVVKLGAWPKCHTLDLTGTPLDENVDNLKIEVLIALDQFTRINDTEVLDEERKDARAEKLERKKAEAEAA